MIFYAGEGPSVCLEEMFQPWSKITVSLERSWPVAGTTVCHVRSASCQERSLASYVSGFETRPPLYARCTETAQTETTGPYVQSAPCLTVRLAATLKTKTWLRIHFPRQPPADSATRNWKSEPRMGSLDLQHALDCTQISLRLSIRMSKSRVSRQTTRQGSRIYFRVSVLDL